MPPTSLFTSHCSQPHITRDEWFKTLDVPPRITASPVREELSATLLGELAFLFHHLFKTDNCERRPDRQEVEYAAKLVSIVLKDLIDEQDPLLGTESLKLLNFIAAPVPVWPEVKDLKQSLQTTIAEWLVNHGLQVATCLMSFWNLGVGSKEIHELQNLLIKASYLPAYTDRVAEIIDLAISHIDGRRISPHLLSGAIALFAAARESAALSNRDRLLEIAINAIKVNYSNGAGSQFVCPYERPLECGKTTALLVDLLFRALSKTSSSGRPLWIPTQNEALDLTTAWLEASIDAVPNYASHDKLLSAGFAEFETLYKRRGVRNISRLRVEEGDDPWALAKKLANRPEQATYGRDVVLCAVTTSDHNSAYMERGYEFEELWREGELNNWVFDYVEVRNPFELLFHLDRHRTQNSRVFLHLFGHGNKELLEFSRVSSHRSQLHISSLWIDLDSRELMQTIAERVDSLVLHSCSGGGKPSNPQRKIRNLVEAIYRATGERTNVTGMEIDDAFDDLVPFRDGNDNRLTEKVTPVWGKKISLKAKT